jgi:DNA invertase Pin-like site-specific DNA recombinase
MTRAAIYARYSSDNQREASIEDQIEVCRRYAELKGWAVVRTYEDRALSGASAARPGFQTMLTDAEHDVFDIVVAESLDRLGRRVADVSALFDDLSFRRIQLHTVATGEVSALLAGILGSVGQQYLIDLRDKTRRGLLGRVLAGKSAGGIGFGYRVQAGSVGERDVVEHEALIVRRTFEYFAKGTSPRAIAKILNHEGVPGPGGRTWRETTIRGQFDRGTGLLNNELYIGRLIWNKCSYVKDPRTGKRQARPNPPEEWEVIALPELRIVHDKLWEAVKARQKETRHNIRQGPAGNGLNGAHRRKYLFSGLLKCGECDGGYTIVGKDRYGCAAHRSKGTCDNSATVKCQTIEERILNGLRTRLMAPDLVAEFAREFTAELNRITSEAESKVAAEKRELASIERKLRGIVEAIEDGMYTSGLKQRANELERRKAELDMQLTAPAVPVIRIHPNLCGLYERKVTRLADALNEEAVKAEASEIIRGLVDKVVLSPSPDETGVRAELYGDICAIHELCESKPLNKKLPGTNVPGSQFSVVAGARNCFDMLLNVSMKAALSRNARNQPGAHVDHAANRSTTPTRAHEPEPLPHSSDSTAT